jgi:hypothetical protein
VRRALLPLPALLLVAASAGGQVSLVAMEEAVPGIEEPVRLRGPLAGLRFAPTGRRGLEGEVFDRRLLEAVAGWAPSLAAEGVTGLRYLSCYRRGARIRRSGRVSGHARGLALDLAVLERGDLEPLDVEHGWAVRDRGADPCATTDDDDEGTALWRRVVCRAVADGRFQIVLTPHHDDDHFNHVHLEVKPEVDWVYVR